MPLPLILLTLLLLSSNSFHQRWQFLPFEVTIFPFRFLAVVPSAKVHQKPLLLLLASSRLGTAAFAMEGADY